MNNLENFAQDKNKKDKIEIKIRKGKSPRSVSRGVSFRSSLIEDLPTELVSIDTIVRFEPEDKMNQPESKKLVDELVEKIKAGNENAIPPVSVMEVKGGYMLLDGHHRFHAHQIANSKFLPVRVVPKERIELIIDDSERDGGSAEN